MKTHATYYYKLKKKSQSKNKKSQLFKISIIRVK